MQLSEDPGPSSKLVRTFSDQLTREAPKDSLVRGLATKVGHDREQEQRLIALRDEWQWLFRDARQLAQIAVPDEEVQLLDKSRALFQAWERFQQQLPAAQRRDLRDQPPSIRLLFETVQNASATWQDKRAGTRRGRLKRIFARLCSSCEDHSQLMAVVPNDDKYICLLTGSLSAIAQATINHERLAEGVADGIKQLSDDLVFWNKQLSVHGDNHAMQGYIKDLYVVIFEFLTDVFVEWSSSGWQRFVNSFNKNSFDRLLSSKRAQMDAIAARLDREANLETQRRIRTMCDDQRKLTQYNKDHMAELKALALDLGSKSQRFLEGLDLRPIAHVGVQQLSQPVTHVLAIEDVPDTGSDAEDLPPTDSHTQEDLKKAIATCKNVAKLQDDELGGILYDTSRVLVDAGVANRLQSWTKSDEADRLWIQGPRDTTRPSQNTLTAISLVALAKRHKIPLISYFCTIADDRHGAALLTDSLADMVSSLILQMVALLPSQFTTGLDLSPVRLGLVDKERGSISEKLDLLRDLRSLLPELVFCIIDGLQVLEDRSDRAHTRHLQQVIYCLCTFDGDHEGGKTMTKVCFTTDGYVDILGAAARADALDKVYYEIDAADGAVDDIDYAK
ncbi:hypothetical protein G647_00880 [Cladophialophora carrionii CBS 160.54]|uniref:DUF7708 domain-containing protein n=1 Tax=Cladophialophora carrionii CBS 160.54 TaxID=1279043 RepID=V9DP59_9EURO|nr:uncharacterized protein G647_00880 [Cladophialophora carrionii CBS 160.54]ETI28431.1 hypothetical protein G647_00880 [Cladophialophora carrionii CBS 160.54]